MGMDVIGRKPKNKTGEYFRANVWSYRPIHFLCMKASLSHKLETGEKELIQPKTLMGMSHNSGHGLRSERKCKLLSEWLELFIEDLFDSPKEMEWFENKIGVDKDGWFYIDYGYFYVGKDGKFLSKEEEKDPNIEKRTPYRTNKEHIQEFIGFLKNCGGFRVC